MPATPAVMAGIFAGAYKNGGTYGTPTWTEQTAVKNATPGFGWEFVEALSRQYPLKLYAKALMDVPFKCTLRADPADTIYSNWVATAMSRINTLDLLLINSKITTQGAFGIRGEYLLSIVDEPQEENGTIYTNFELRPSLTANGIPQWVIMGASSTPSFTAFSYTT